MFAQLVGLFGTALFFASYQCRDNRQLFRVQFLSYLCYTAHLFLLGAATGAVSYLINTFRSFCLSSRYDFLRSRAMGAVICVLQILALVFTWSGWLSVLPVAANIATTIGGYTYNARTIRSVGMFINSPLWIAVTWSASSPKSRASARSRRPHKIEESRPSTSQTAHIPKSAISS